MANILLIDDNDSFRTIAQTVLERAGHHVRSAGNGQEGLSLFHQTRPDLVITDLFMPEKDGLETMSDLLREDPRVRIIVISGGLPKSDCDWLQMSLHFGAKRALAKPLAYEEFLAAVDTVLAS